MGNKLLKRLQDGYVAPSDNTRVVRPIISTRLTPKQIEAIRNKKLIEVLKKNLAHIYDADKAKFYQHIQDRTNASLFGPSSPTHYDYTTSEGLQAIQAVGNLSASNAMDLVMNALGGMISKPIVGILPRGANIGGRIESLAPFKIGGGAEAEVFDNGLQVLKVGSIGTKEMSKRNAIPNVIKSKYVGRIKTPYSKLNAYTLKKVKILTDETFPKYVNKLDKAMEKSGFRKVNDPNVLYRAYTNGQIVVDDVSPGNVGLDWLKRPKMIDFNLLTVPEWVEQGFTLKDGGKLFNIKNKLIPKNLSGKPINLNTLLSQYPEVSLNEEPWADEYFRNNPNVAGMAIGGGLNGVQGKRRVIVNPYNKYMKNPTLREGLLMNERLRHYMDETNFNLPHITGEQINKYKGTSYENDTINIGRTEAARYLVNDKSNSLTDEQIKYVKSYFNK